MFHVYVLKSERTGRRYVGSCENFEDRFRRHNAGELDRLLIDGRLPRPLAPTTSA
jgi:predicted GIY-YIG superfamily endonuclease